jgi:hypothetical protein
MASPFPQAMEESATHLGETLSNRLSSGAKSPSLRRKGKYDHLVANAVISAEELELDQRVLHGARISTSRVFLIDEFQVKLQRNRRRRWRLFFKSRTSRTVPIAQ